MDFTSAVLTDEVLRWAYALGLADLRFLIATSGWILGTVCVAVGFRSLVRSRLVRRPRRRSASDSPREPGSRRKRRRPDVQRTSRRAPRRNPVSRSNETERSWPRSLGRAPGRP